MQTIPLTELFLRWLNASAERAAIKRDFEDFRRRHGAEMPVPHQNWAAAFLAITGLSQADFDQWSEYYSANRKHVRPSEWLKAGHVKIVEAV